MKFIFLCIYLFFNNIFSKSILLSFKQSTFYSKEKKYNSTLFLEDNLEFISYSLINIGNPKQSMVLLFNQNNKEILVHNNNQNCKYLSKKYNYTSNYLPENSKSVKILNYTYYNVTKNGISRYIINEEIEFFINKNYSNKIKSYLNFYYLKENNNYSNSYCADFGFPINKNLNGINSMTFIQQLKSQKIIDDYLITIEFISSFEGFYHIGDFPHTYNKSYFKEYQLISAYSIPKIFLFQFQLSIEQIYITFKNNSILNKIQFNSDKIYFDLELGIIQGTNDYFKKIKEIFFNKYFEKKICKTDIIQKTKFEPIYSTMMPKNYYIISCQKNKIIDNLFFDYKLFPSINFFHKEMNFTFTLTYNELFQEVNDVYYFLIVNTLNDDKDWKIGIPFLRKYQTTFNIDTRKIYFYNKNIRQFNNNKKKNINKENNLYLIFICVLLTLFLIGFAFILGKKINEHRKMRKNELEDGGYNYLDSEKRLSSKKGNIKLIEMNLKEKILI